jgi:hypothetical protein
MLLPADGKGEAFFTTFHCKKGKIGTGPMIK